jgi:hypothetical protein
MIKLAETEVMAFVPTPQNIQDESSGIWLTRLEEYGKKMDLPGAVGITMFLKGEIRFKQGRFIEAQELEEAVKEMSKLPGLAYLKDKAHHSEMIQRQRKR